MKNIMLIIIALLLLTSVGSKAQEKTVTRKLSAEGSSSTQGETIKRKFSAEGIRSLQIITDPGNIEVRTWRKSEILIEISTKNTFELYNLIVDELDHAIKVHFEIDNSWHSNINFIIHSPKSMSFKLETTGGNISFEDDINGNLNLETDGGHITFQNVKGTVLAKTKGGHITGEDINDDVELHSDGGHITLGNINNGKAIVSSYGGHINIGDVNSDVKATTHGGNIEVTNVGGNANILTYGGHISIEKVSGYVDMETYGGNLYLGTATGKVKAITMGGHIQLDEITGSVKAKTNGGNIQAKLNPAKNSSSSLGTEAGNITIMIPPQSKTEIKVNIEHDAIKYNAHDLLISDFNEEFLKIYEDDGELTAKYFLNSGGSKIKLFTSYGKIKIYKWKK